MTFIHDYFEQFGSAGTIPTFLSQCAVADPLQTTSSLRMYEAFVYWLGENEHAEPCSHRRFSQELLKMGLHKKKSNGWQWLGVRLRLEIAHDMDN